MKRRERLILRAALLVIVIAVGAAAIIAVLTERAHAQINGGCRDEANCTTTTANPSASATASPSAPATNNVTVGGGAGGLGGAGGAGGLGGAGGIGQGGAGGSVTGSGNSTATGGTSSATGGSSTAAGGNATGGNATGGNAAGGNAAGGNSSNALTVEGDSSSTNYQAPRIPVATAYAPNVMPTALCALGVSAGAQGVSFGLSFGSSFIDTNCQQLEQVRTTAAVLGDRATGRRDDAQHQRDLPRRARGDRATVSDAAGGRALVIGASTRATYGATMKVKIENQSDEPIRVIVDYDNVNETILDAGASDVFESEDEGVIELREGDGSDDIQRDDE